MHYGRIRRVEEVQAFAHVQQDLEHRLSGDVVLIDVQETVQTAAIQVLRSPRAHVT